MSLSGLKVVVFGRHQEENVTRIVATIEDFVPETKRKENKSVEFFFRRKENFRENARRSSFYFDWTLDVNEFLWVLKVALNVKEASFTQHLLDDRVPPSLISTWGSTSGIFCDNEAPVCAVHLTPTK